MTPRRTRSYRPHSTSLLQAAAREIEGDLASSTRHWTEVLESARVGRSIEVSDRGRARYDREIARAEDALARLTRGESVAIWPPSDESAR
jgi:hypothetical protein